jgi:hypothetical protein
MVALATAPAGAGAGNLEVYSAPNYSGTHVTVPSATVGSYVDKCVSVYTLTSAGLTTSQSMTNNTSYTLGLYGATNCTASSFIVSVSANSQWTTLTNETVRSIRITK